MHKPDILFLNTRGEDAFVELGALVSLQTEGYLDKLHTYISVSSGSIIALLLVCGFLAKEIVTIAAETNIMSDNIDIFLGETLKYQLRELVHSKYGYVPSLQEFYILTGIEFIPVTYNLSRRMVEHLSYKSEPHISVIDAVMLSTNSPSFSRRVLYNNCFYIDAFLHYPLPDNKGGEVLSLITRRKRRKEISTARQYNEEIENSLLSAKIEETPLNCTCLLLSVSPTEKETTVEEKALMVMRGVKRAYHFIG